MTFWISLHTMDKYFGARSEEECLTAATENFPLIAEVAECYARLNPGKVTKSLGVRDLSEVRLSLLPEAYRQ